MTFRDLGRLLKTTVLEFTREHPLHHGAALSYYALMALIPILYLSVTIFGSFVGQDTMQDIIRELLHENVGVNEVGGIIDFLGQVDLSGSFALKTMGAIALMLSSTAILNSLKRSINEFYDLDRLKLGRRKKIVRNIIFRLVSMVVIGVMTSVVIAIYFLETLVLSLEERYFADNAFVSWLFSNFAHHILPIILNFFVFTFIFKYLHDGFVRWKVAITGGIITGIFLYLGQLLIKFYLANYFFAAEGGVAGTLLIILVWVYYSSQILFLGAKFSCVYANFLGTPIETKE
ncbi:MAG: YihY/virulence factor BrkB family protein [bacterium]|nr:YihY/virulence factor BrkB family protein [bacterium]